MFLQWVVIGGDSEVLYSLFKGTCPGRCRHIIHFDCICAEKNRTAALIASVACSCGECVFRRTWRILLWKQHPLRVLLLSLSQSFLRGLSVVSIQVRHPLPVTSLSFFSRNDCAFHWLWPTSYADGAVCIRGMVCLVAGCGMGLIVEFFFFLLFFWTSIFGSEC